MAAGAKADGEAMFRLHHLGRAVEVQALRMPLEIGDGDEQVQRMAGRQQRGAVPGRLHHRFRGASRSEEHTSELQSLMRSSYAVFCLKKKKYHNEKPTPHYTLTNCLKMN